MQNPYISYAQAEKPVKKNRSDEAQVTAEQVQNAAAPSTMGLALGKLLIRMGEKLTQQEATLKSSREHA